MASKEQKRKEELKNRLESMISFSRLGMRNNGVLNNRSRSIRYYRGNHKIRARSRRKGNQVYNKFAEIINNRIALLTSLDVRWVFKGQSDDDVFLARALNQILSDVIFDASKWNEGKSETFILEALFSGYSYTKTVITENGWPDFIPIYNDACLVDPLARSVSNQRFIGHVTSKDVKEVKDIFDVEVAPDADLDMLQEVNDDLFAELSFNSAGDNKMPASLLALRKAFSRTTEDFMGTDFSRRVRLFEIWMRDLSTEPVPFDPEEVRQRIQIGASGNKIPVRADDNHKKFIKAYQEFESTLNPNIDDKMIEVIDEAISVHKLFPGSGKRLKYPRGRVITLGGGKILQDKPNPLPMDFTDVFVRMDCYKVPGTIFSKSFTEDLFDPQDNLNHRKNSITTNINLVTNGMVKVRAALLKMIGNKNRFNNMAGNIFPVINPDDISVDFGKPLPNHFFNDVILEKNFMDEVSGKTDLLSGRLPQGDVPGVTVSTLLNQSQSIVRLVIKHYVSALNQMGRNAILIMQEFMDENERFEIIGQDGKKTNINWASIKDNITSLKNIRVDSSNTLHTSRDQRLKQALELRNIGVYDDIAVLEEIDDPKKFELINRKNQVAQLVQVVKSLQNENETLKKNINTMLNRAQSEKGLGNVGVENVANG